MAFSSLWVDKLALERNSCLHSLKPTPCTLAWAVLPNAHLQRVENDKEPLESCSCGSVPRVGSQETEEPGQTQQWQQHKHTLEDISADREENTTTFLLANDAQ